MLFAHWRSLKPDGSATPCKNETIASQRAATLQLFLQAFSPTTSPRPSRVVGVIAIFRQVTIPVGRENPAEMNPQKSAFRIRNTEMELGPQKTFDWVGYFKFLQRHGNVDFVPQ
jgi:hypothetical protein